MKKIFQKKNTLNLITLKSILLFCFIWRVIPIFFMKSINISTDEFTVIGMAAYLAGLDWTDVIRPQYYYGYPMSIIYAPIFFINPLLKYPIILYRLCLFINALLGMLNTWIIYKLLFRLNSNTKTKSVLWLTLIYSLAASSVAFEKVLTNETLLSLCFNLAIYISISFVDNCKKRNIINSLILGAISVLAYVINGRGIILFAMILVLWLIMKIFRKTYYLYICPYLLSIFGLFLVHFKIKAYYLGTFFTPTNMNVANSGFDEYIEILIKFFSTNGLLALFIAVIGLLYTLTFSSYGFCIILLFVTIGIFISKKVKRQTRHAYFESPCNMELYVLIILCFFFILLSIGISVVHFGNFFYDMSTKIKGGEIHVNRADRMFYSRYTSTIKPLIIVFGIYIVEKIEKQYRKKLFLISFMFIFLLCILFQAINAPLIDNISYASSNSPELSIILTNLHEDFKYGTVKAERFIFTSIIIIILTSFYYICYLKDKTKVFKICFTCINITMGFLLLTEFLIPRSEYYYNIPNKNIITYLSDIYKETSDITFITDGTEDYLYQMHLPKVKIINWDTTAIETYNELIIVNYDRYELTLPENLFYEVVINLSTEEKILVKGNKTIEYFKANNFVIDSYYKEH